MNLRNIIRRLPLLAAALCGLAATSCADDDTLTVNTSAVTAADDYVDSRDGHVYHCIKVGDRVWTTENLAYFLPRGAADGCVTWEEQQDITEEELTVDTTNIVVVISDADYETIYFGVVNDPDHDWKKECGMTNQQLKSYFLNFYGELFTQEEFTNMYVNNPASAAFGNLLLERLNVERERQRQAYIERLIAEKAQIPIDHRDKAEAANGGYVSTHGYLYTLAGARKAVPTDDGWRLPTDDDWKALEQALGMPAAELDRMNAWRGEGFGDALKEGGTTGFNAVMSGCNAYQRTQEELFINKDEGAYFWTSDEGSYTTEETSDDSSSSTADDEGKVTVTYSTGIIRQLAIYSSKIWRGTTRLDNSYRGVTYSVRMVRDAK